MKLEEFVCGVLATYDVLWRYELMIHQVSKSASNTRAMRIRGHNRGDDLEAHQRDYYACCFLT